MAGCVGVGSAALVTSSTASSGEVAFEIPIDEVNDDDGLAHGLGAHDDAHAHAQHGAVRQVYEDLALEFGMLGAAVSVLALRTAPCLGLEAIYSLASRTGGVLQLYNDLSDCTVADDVYKMLRRCDGCHGVLAHAC